VASGPWGGAAAPTAGPTSDAAPVPAPSVPTEAIEAPASVARPGVVAPGARKSVDDEAIASASASGIPDAALAAYQRAETVINAADKSCNISWQLIAAIGRVESDHGRVNGNSLDDEGLATPGIYGIALDGTHNTTAIRDTDAGQYDADARWDRAVGPMQFIPSTWSVVGVDGDNDGKRNPQDVDDAALASAVYLCSGSDDLSTDAGRRAAVFRYNHSQDYVDLVLSFMDAYLDGDFTSVPNGTSSSGYFVPSPEPVRPEPTRPQVPANQPPASGGTTSGSTSGGGGDTDGGGGGGDTDGGTPITPPTDGGTDGDGDGGGGLPDLPALPGGGGGDGGGGGGGGDPVDDVLTEVEAKAQCIAQDKIDNPVTAVNELAQCIDGLLGG